MTPDHEAHAPARRTARGLATSNVEAARAMLQLYPAEDMLAELKAPRRIDGTPMITWEQINNVLWPTERRRTEPKWKNAL